MRRRAAFIAVWGESAAKVSGTWHLLREHYAGELQQHCARQHHHHHQQVAGCSRLVRKVFCKINTLFTYFDYYPMLYREIKITWLCASQCLKHQTLPGWFLLQVPCCWQSLQLLLSWSTGGCVTHYSCISFSKLRIKQQEQRCFGFFCTQKKAKNCDPLNSLFFFFFYHLFRRHKVYRPIRRSLVEDASAHSGAAARMVRLREALFPSSEESRHLLTQRHPL